MVWFHKASLKDERSLCDGEVPYGHLAVASSPRDEPKLSAANVMVQCDIECDDAMR